MFSGPVSSAQVAAAMRAQSTPQRPPASAFSGAAQQVPFRGAGGGLAALGNPNQQSQQQFMSQLPAMAATAPRGFGPGSMGGFNDPAAQEAAMRAALQSNPWSGGGMPIARQNMTGQPSMMPPPQPAMGGGQVSTQQPIVTNGGGLQALSQPAPQPSMASAAGGSGYDLSTRDGRMAWMRNHDNMTPEQLRGGGQQQPSTTQPQFTQVGGYNVPGANPPQQIVQPGMPGQLDMIARQLSMGGYGDMAGIRQHMDQFYKPMSMPNYGATPLPNNGQNMTGPNALPTTPMENSPWARAQAAARGQQPGRQMPGGGDWRSRWNAGRK